MQTTSSEEAEHKAVQPHRREGKRRGRKGEREKREKGCVCVCACVCV